MNISNLRRTMMFMQTNCTGVYRRVSRGGGAKGPGPHPIEIEKKRSSEQILSYFTYILLLF